MDKEKSKMASMMFLLETKSWWFRTVSLHGFIEMFDRQLEKQFTVADEYKMVSKRLKCEPNNNVTRCRIFN